MSTQRSATGPIVYPGTAGIGVTAIEHGHRTPLLPPSIAGKLMKQLAVVVLAFLATQQATAQSIARTCLLAEPPPHTQLVEKTIVAGAARIFFDFNGTYKDATGAAIPGFECSIVGPLEVEGRDWYIQRVKGLAALGQPVTNPARADVVRLCTKRERKVDHKTGAVTIIGPTVGLFGGQIGPKDCELVLLKDVP